MKRKHLDNLSLIKVFENWIQRFWDCMISRKISVTEKIFNFLTLNPIQPIWTPFNPFGPIWPLLIHLARFPPPWNYLNPLKPILDLFWPLLAFVDAIVWKFLNFSVSQILREIKVGKSQCGNLAIFLLLIQILREINFGILEVQKLTFLAVLEPLNALKWQILYLKNHHL